MRVLKMWTEGEEAYLKEAFAHTPNKELAEKLGRSLPALKNKVNRMGLSKTVPEEVKDLDRWGATWEPDELETLEEFYAGASVEDLAKVLGRTPRSIYQKALNLGLRKDIRKDVREFSLYKGDEVLARGNLHEISQSLGIEYKTVQYYSYSAYRRRTSEDIGRRLVYEGNRLLEEFGIDEEE